MTNKHPLFSYTNMNHESLLTLTTASDCFSIHTLSIATFNITMPTIKFGPYSKNVFQENRTTGNKRNKLELNTQHFTLPEINAISSQVTTVRLVYNTGFLVDTECYESLLPVTKLWQGQEETSIDAAFPILNQTFHQFEPGKSIRRWQEEIPGFGPCLAFNAEYTPNSPLFEAIQSSLLEYRLRIDNQSYRIIHRGIGFYLGPKGQTKQRQRSSSDSYPASDPLSEVNRCSYKNEINLDLRFALATEHAEGMSAELPERYFYHGKHPLISFSLNIHLEPNSKHPDRLTSWENVHAAITQHIDPFKAFVTRSTIINNITQPDQFKNSGYWAKADRIMQRAHSPTVDSYITQNIDDNNTPNAVSLIHDIGEATEEYRHTTRSKWPELFTPLHNNEASAPSHYSKRDDNVFSVLSIDTDESESDDSYEESVMNKTSGSHS